MAIKSVRGVPLGQLFDLEGRVAVVTGSGRGVGAACAHRLAEAGARVYVTDVDEGAATKVARQLEEAGLDATARQLDVSDPEALTALAESVIGEEGQLDIWVNNAGIYPVGFIPDLTPEDWRRVQSINADAVFHGSRAAALQMQGRGGVIVNIASTNSSRAAPGLAAYVTSKHAVIGVTKAIAAEFASHDVRALAIAPSLVATEGMDEHAESLRPVFGGSDPREVFPQIVPLGRVADPDDVARVVLFAASDMATFMTGSTLVVDGGLLAV